MPYVFPDLTSRPQEKSYQGEAQYIYREGLA